MTIAQLIKELRKIPDKTKDVASCTGRAIDLVEIPSAKSPVIYLHAGYGKHPGCWHKDHQIGAQHELEQENKQLECDHESYASTEFIGCPKCGIYYGND